MGLLFPQMGTRGIQIFEIHDRCSNSGKFQHEPGKLLRPLTAKPPSSVTLGGPHILNATVSNRMFAVQVCSRFEKFVNVQDVTLAACEVLLDGCKNIVPDNPVIFSGPTTFAQAVRIQVQLYGICVQDH